MEMKRMEMKRMEMKRMEMKRMEMNNMESLMQHIQINPKTGETEYYFPLEIKDESVRAYAKVYGYASGYARLGQRVFPAVMIPCRPDNGRPVTVEEQKRIYCRLVEEELKQERRRNEEKKQDEDDGMSAMREGLREEKKYGRKLLANDGLCLEMETPDSYGHADSYILLCNDFLTWVKRNAPGLYKMAALLAQEYNLEESAQILKIDSHQAAEDCLKLQHLIREFVTVQV